MERTIEHLYIHYPHCRHLCNYCDFFKTKKLKGTDNHAFEDYLSGSWKIHSEFLSKNMFSWGNLKTLYIGGGTPSLWGGEGAKFLRSFLKDRNISFQNDYEFTIEVNPGTWDDETIKSWKESGANRFSIGLQSTNDFYLKTLDRVHSYSEAKSTLEYFKKLNANFSVDFMIGLPFSQTFRRDIISELKEIIEYYPSHFSVYILTVGKQYSYYKDLPCEDWIEDEYSKVSETLNGLGFNQYEVSNFGLKGKESLHNFAYWKQKSVAALGPSATGFLAGEDNAIRYKWKTSDAQFGKEVLGPKELLIEKVFLGLRSTLGFNLNNLGVLDQRQNQLIKDWFEKGFLVKTDQYITLTPKGFFQMDTLVSGLISSI